MRGGDDERVDVGVGVLGMTKLQALVNDILPSTTAVFNYGIGSRKLSLTSRFLLLLVVVVLKQ